MLRDDKSRIQFHHFGRLADFVFGLERPDLERWRGVYLHLVQLVGQSPGRPPSAIAYIGKSDKTIFARNLDHVRGLLGLEYFLVDPDAYRRSGLRDGNEAANLQGAWRCAVWARDATKPGRECRAEHLTKYDRNVDRVIEVAKSNVLLFDVWAAEVPGHLQRDVEGFLIQRLLDNPKRASPHPARWLMNAAGPEGRPGVHQVEWDGLSSTFLGFENF